MLKRRVSAPGVCITWLTAALMMAMFVLWPGCQSAQETKPVAAAPMLHQTDVDRAEHLFDASGVPYLRIAEVGEVRNPAWVALYALEYAGVEQYGAGKPVAIDPDHSRACVQWLADNLKTDPAGDLVWQYSFDDTYNDVTVKAPWASAFGQATGIQALLYSAQHGGPAKYVDLAAKAAQSLLRPISDGGLKYQKGKDVWFEEIANSAENPPHILNGHMRALLALRELAAATRKPEFKSAYQEGRDTLIRWLPLYDNGYWLRYDLNPQKSELLFRINNPYGYALPALAIDHVSLRDPLSGDEVKLSIGTSNDAEGSLRIAGNDWSQPTTLDGRTVRRLQPVIPVTSQEELDGEIHTPGTFFYLKLPSAWKDNLRSEELELVISYKDEAPGNATVQMRSIGPGPAFRDLPDSDLLLRGTGEWREWRIPLHPSDLGYWVGLNYGRKHSEYLQKLAEDDSRLKPWAARASGYVQWAQRTEAPHFVQLSPPVTLTQTPMLPKYTLDPNGVIQQYSAGPETRFTPSGLYIPDSPMGPPVYSPYLSAMQVLSGPEMPGGVFTTINRSKIEREPGLQWLLSPSNFSRIGNANVFPYNFPNAYNDVATPAPWQSAFGQAYVLKAFLYAEDHLPPDPAVSEALRSAARAFDLEVSSGGLKSVSPQGLPFFEEVPNSVHILNADLVALATLRQVADKLHDEHLSLLVTQGVQAMREYMRLYNTGYWLRYDLNPKKDFLLQLDWSSGDTSPLIQSVTLVNPQTMAGTRVNVGVDGDFDGYPHIAGVDWQSPVTVDGMVTRSFRDGYTARAEAVAGGVRHNVFVQAVLPERSFDDCLNVPTYMLTIHYKDVAKGLFVIKSQAINVGQTLAFVPIRGGQLRCIGDGKWKDAVFALRPQDLGWYVGPDYQSYHVEQLTELAKQTGDWFFQQRALEQSSFLAAAHSGDAVILESAPPIFLEDIATQAKVISSSPMYPKFGVENALDGDPNNNYAAAVEGPLPQEFVLDLGHPTDLRQIKLVWESDENFATQYEIDSIKGDGSSEALANVKKGEGKIQDIKWPGGKTLQRLRFVVYATHGQPRLLLRQVEILVPPMKNEPHKVEAIPATESATIPGNSTRP